MELKQLTDADTHKKQEAGGFYLEGVNLSKMTDLDEDSKGKVILQCIEISKKMAKIADAVDDYHKLEEEELNKLVKSAKSSGNHPDLIMANDSTKLQAKVEEALSQTKSALDVAVKILSPLTGIASFTFGKKGKTVVNDLKNLPKELKERAEPLIEHLEGNKAQLTMIINYRDTQHFKNLAISSLRVDQAGNHELPNMPDGQSVAKFLEDLFNYTFVFLQDFVAYAIYIRLVGGLVIVTQGEGRKREYGVGISSDALQKES